MGKIFTNIQNLVEQAFIEKAYTEGVYADTPQNRKLGRVGMSYKEWTSKQPGQSEEDKKEEKNKNDWKNDVNKDDISEIQSILLSHYQNEGSIDEEELYDRTEKLLSDIVGNKKANKILKQEGINKRTSSKENLKTQNIIDIHENLPEINIPVFKSIKDVRKFLGLDGDGSTPDEFDGGRVSILTPFGNIDYYNTKRSPNVILLEVADKANRQKDFGKNEYHLENEEELKEFSHLLQKELKKYNEIKNRKNYYSNLEKIPTKKTKLDNGLFIKKKFGRNSWGKGYTVEIFDNKGLIKDFDFPSNEKLEDSRFSKSAKAYTKNDLITLNYVLCKEKDNKNSLQQGNKARWKK